MSDFSKRLDKILAEQEVAASQRVDPTSSSHEATRSVTSELGGGKEENYITRDDLAVVLQGFISAEQFQDLMKVLDQRVFKPLEEMQGIFK